jgi:hypothetical protein
MLLEHGIHDDVAQGSAGAAVSNVPRGPSEMIGDGFGC